LKGVDHTLVSSAYQGALLIEALSNWEGGFHLQQDLVRRSAGVIGSTCTDLPTWPATVAASNQGLPDIARHVNTGHRNNGRHMLKHGAHSSRGSLITGLTHSI
jgi:hypothetical protein